MGQVEKHFQDTKITIKSLEALSSTWETLLQKNFFRKYDFVNIAGGAASAVGFHSFNKIQKLSNGYLSILGDAKGNVEAIANKISNLNHFLKDRGINFLFVMAPAAFAMPDAKFAPGYSMNYSSQSDEMIKRLQDSSVLTLPMAQIYKKDGWSLEDVFFRTDHHWRPGAALKAAQKSMELISSQGWATYKSSTA